MPTFRIALTVAALLALVAPAHGGTLHVASNGIDGFHCGVGIGGTPCGSKSSPCRSITCGIRNAAAGDKIIVGPGVYGGDLNGNGSIGEGGEEAPTPGCGCTLAVNKNVLIVTDGGEFGRPGKGFTVTNTANAGGAGIVIDATNVKVRGNQVVATGMGSSTFASTLPRAS
jgi:hypothetical protein